MTVQQGLTINSCQKWQGLMHKKAMDLGCRSISGFREAHPFAQEDEG